MYNHPVFPRSLGVGVLICFALLGEPHPTWVEDRFENGDFTQGKSGEFPMGWHLGPDGTPNYVAETASAGACLSGQQCGAVRSVGPESNSFCFLHQIFDAKQYRGKTLVFRAAVRANFPGSGVARLLVRIHREDGSTSFRDDMGNHPITSGPWAFYEIHAPIVDNARDIELGMQVFGQGAASLDRISLNYSK